MNIISASRRTDIPKYFSKWFLNRLKKGFAIYKTPFSKEHYKVSMVPQDVQAIVFWTKDFSPLMPFLEQIEKSYKFVVHYTITALGKPFERNIPSKEISIETFKKLSDKIGKHRVFWRFDPILLSNATNADFYIKEFERMAKELHDYTSRCYFSSADFYKRAKLGFEAHLTKFGIECYDPDISERQFIANKLAEIASSFNLPFLSCCENELTNGKIKEGACVDSAYINKIFPETATIRKKLPTRKGCNCTESKDIGMMDSCIGGCVYCYANMSLETAKTNIKKHHIDSSAIIG